MEYSFITITPRDYLPGMVITAGVPSTGQIELFDHLPYMKPFNCVQIELLVLVKNTWNYLTVSKQ